MRRERHQQFQATYGFASDTLQSLEFFDEDWKAIDANHPAHPGAHIIAKAADLGPTDPEVPAGQAFPHGPFAESILRIDLRVRNKIALQTQMGLAPEVDRPLLGVVSRLSDQKGLDLLLQALPGIVARGGQLALLGSGDPVLEGGFTAAATSRPDSISCVLGYDEKLAHLIQAGADFIVVPSRFEPCGLTQLCALRYGAPPIVARVGGLADTVIDANEAATAAGVATGLQFYPPAVDSLTYALNRALDIARDPAVLRRLRLNGMRSDVSWRGPAKRYAVLYREIIRPAE